MSLSISKESSSEASEHSLHRTITLPQWMNPTGEQGVGIVNCNHVSSERKKVVTRNISDDQFAALFDDACNKAAAELWRKECAEIRRRERERMPRVVGGRTSPFGWLVLILLEGAFLVIPIATIDTMIPLKQMYFWKDTIANVYEEKTMEGWDTIRHRHRHRSPTYSRVWSVTHLQKYKFSIANRTYDGQTTVDDFIQESSQEELPSGVIRRIRISYNPENPSENEVAVRFVKDGKFKIAIIAGFVALILLVLICWSICQFIREVVRRIICGIKQAGSYDAL